MSMSHQWNESYNADLTSVIFTCSKCRRRVAVAKNRCDFFEPDEELLDKNGVSSDCAVEQVRQIHES